MLTPKYQRAWKDLVRAGRGFGTDPRFRKYLRLVRNENVFHYNRPAELMTAYAVCFDRDSRTEHSANLYVSVGANMEATRFF